MNATPTEDIEQALWREYAAATNPDQRGADEAAAIDAAIAWARRPPPPTTETPDPELEKLPPLYTPAPQGEWTYHGADYSINQVRRWVRRELNRCRRSLVHFAEHWCFTVHKHLEGADDDPVPTVERIPSGVSALTGRPWVHVRAILGFLDPPQDIVIEKSRDMLVSWLAMTAALHDVLFRANWSVMTMSNMEDRTDDGGQFSTEDSLHGKSRFVYMHLPAMFHAAFPVEFKHLQIRHEAINSHVTGYSTTAAAGRGPKYKRAILDEFAQVERGHEVLHSVSPACPVGKVLISTPRGKANAFYDIREKAVPAWPEADPRAATFLGWKRVTVRWQLHPERGPDWFARMTAKMTAEGIAQEFELNYEKALEGRVYPKFSRERHLRPIAYDARLPLVLTCDWNYDPLVWEIAQRHPGLPPFCVIDEIARRGADKQDAICEFVLRYGSRTVVNQWLGEHPEWADVYGRHGMCVAGELGHRGPLFIYGDATAEAKTFHSKVRTYQELVAVFRQAGFEVHLKVPPANPPVQHRLEVVNHALAHDLISVDPKCEQLQKDFESGVWDKARADMEQRKEDDDGSGLTRSHASSAFGYWLSIVHKPYTTVTATTRAQARSARTYLPEFVRHW